MSGSPTRNHRRVRTQAIVVSVVLVASGLETLALTGGAPAAGDVLLGLIALAMLAAAVGG